MKIQRSFYNRCNVMKLNFSEAMTYFFLVKRADKGTLGGMSLVSISQCIRFDKKCVYDALNKLEKLGYITVIHMGSGGICNTYKLNKIPRNTSQCDDWGFE